MAQEMTLSVYLQQRGKKAKALTRIEAEVFGIPFPLLAGWPRRHGAMTITEEMIRQIEELAAAADQATDRPSRRSRKRVAAALPSAGVPVMVEHSATRREVVAPSFPGFALRLPKRHRAKESAPWT